MHRGHGNERSGVDCIHHGVNALQKAANSFRALLFGNRDGLVIQLAQVSARRKNRVSGAVNYAGGGFRGQRDERAHKYFQLFQHCRANFIGGLTIKRQLDAPLLQFPAQRLALEALHACCLLTAWGSVFCSYMALISAANRAWTASRRSLPLTVSSPLSAVKALPTILKFRTCR